MAQNADVVHKQSNQENPTQNMKPFTLLQRPTIIRQPLANLTNSQPTQKRKQDEDTAQQQNKKSKATSSHEPCSTPVFSLTCDEVYEEEQVTETVITVPTQVTPIVPSREDEEDDKTEQIYNIDWLRKREKYYQPKANYMTWQSHLDTIMRAILIDWIYEVSLEYGLFRETVQLTINYIDRFMSSFPDVAKDRFQLVGVTALFIACKVEEVSCPPARDMIVVCDNTYTLDQLFMMEKLMSDKLNWNFMAITPCSWLRLYLSMYKDELSVEFPKHEFYRYNQLLDYAFHDITCLRFLPSQLAAAAFCIYCKDNALLKKITGYTESELSECVAFLKIYGAIPPGKHYITPAEFITVSDFSEKPWRNESLLTTVKQRLKILYLEEINRLKSNNNNIPQI